MGWFGISMGKKVKKTEPKTSHQFQQSQQQSHGGRQPASPKYQAFPDHPPPPPPTRVTQPLPIPIPQNHHQAQEFRPAGYLLPPPGWSPPASYTYLHQPPPIVVNQYYLSAPPPPPFSVSQPQIHRPYAHGGTGSLSKLNLGSMVNLANEVLPPGLQVPKLFDDGLPAWHGYGTQLVNQGAACCDQISTKLNDVLTLIDLERYRGNEKELFSFHPAVPGLPLTSGSTAPSTELAIVDNSAPSRKQKKGQPKDHPKGQTTAVAASVISGNYFAKVELYANSRLPMNLPPLKLYIPTWPILCLAAQYSERVYERPRGAERDTHVDADWRTGSKAMVIKSVPMDHMSTIVFAIRGTATFMDWAVNLNMAPTSPVAFLDDPGNFCHAGFLSVARKMIHPVASRLRRLLEEDPSRSSYSLLLTGHSAGGAIAALLYSHMLSKTKAAESELSSLASCFRRIHCVTFGTPPVSFLPLATPPGLRKSLFLSFINEGDPVARADKAYVKSLLELFAAPAPTVESGTTRSGHGGCPTKALKESSGNKSKPSLSSSKTGKSAKSSSSSPPLKGSSISRSTTPRPTWKLPPSTLSSAGRIVVLRSGDPKARLNGRKTVEERLNEGVVAQVATDEQLRTVVWGDPVAHLMRLYAGRVETLAVGAVTAKGY